MTAVAAVSFGLAAALLADHVRGTVEGRTLHRRAQEQVGLRVRRESLPRPQLDKMKVAKIGGGIAVGSVAGLLIGPVGLAFGAVPALVSRSLHARATRTRHQQVDDQLASALQLVIGHLKIGRNVVAALAEAADVTPQPLGGILEEIVAEARLGLPVDEVLARVADAEENRHLGIVASAVGLHTRHGGQLVEILENVLGTIEEEDRLRRDIKSLTADGRLSATVLMAMPPAMLVLVSILSPGYATPLFVHPTGRVMLYAGVVLGLVGWRWLRALGTPKVVA